MRDNGTNHMNIQLEDPKATHIQASDFHAEPATVALLRKDTALAISS